MTIALSRIRANEFPDGISKWYVKRAGDTGYYDLGPLNGDSIDVKPAGTIIDSHRAPRQNALDFLAKAKLFNTEKTNMIKMLDYLFLSDTDHVILGINGVHEFSSALLTHAPYFGFKGSFVSDSDMNDNRYIEIEADRRLTLTGAYDEWTLLTDTPPSVPGSQPTTDVLHALASIARGGEVTAGFSKVEIDDTGGTPQDVGVIRNGKFKADFYGTKTSRQMTHCTAIYFDISVELLQAALTEIIQAKAIVNTDIDVKITFMDGLIFAITNTLGIEWSFNLKESMNDTAFVTLGIKGAIYSAPGASSTWDGLWSGGT